MINYLKNHKYLILISAVALFLVNLAQGFFTELLADEAYYWVYSQHLSWGYFDHPPMVAIWIKISSWFFENGELSVRFFSSVMLSIVMYLVWFLLDHPKKQSYRWLYILLFISTALLNVFGFITTPDTPLLFFFVVFLLGYQRYLKLQDFWSYLLVTISVAGMLYSKYQGGVIILFVVISNFKLLRDYKLWIAFLASLLLFLPHLYWQYDNDFASLRYHLLERGVNKRYKFRYTYMHFVNAIAIIGFTFPILYKALFKSSKIKDQFSKTMQFIVYGFITFFFLMSFKGHVQAQWIVSISVPLIYLTFNFLINNTQNIKLFTKLAVITIVVSTYIRFFLVNDKLLPVLELEMHNNKEWVSELDEKLGDKTPLFQNSYQNTSTYWFYTQKRPYQFNTYWSRKNQYDILKYNGKLRDTSVIEVRDFPHKHYDQVKKRKGFVYITDIGEFTSLRDIKFEILDENQELKIGENNIQVSYVNPYDDINMEKIKIIVLLLSDNKKILKEGKSTYKAKFTPSLNNKGTLSFKIKNYPETKIGYVQVLTQSHPIVTAQRNSAIYKVIQR